MLLKIVYLLTCRVLGLAVLAFREYVVVDCTAGAESFASGMFTRFDLTFLVAEPTRKGVGVWR
ncbi:MAG: hypothetical protein ABSF03_10725, partial [Streptosporangiaceae bacterium]